MRKLFLALAVLVALVALAACAAPAPTPAPTAAPAATQPPSATKAGEATKAPAATQPPAQAQKGGTFINVSFADGVSLQPLLTSDNASSNYQALVWAPLTRIDPKTFEIKGVLYEDSPTFSADGSKMTWKLREGVKWSDGKPITAQDVEFNWQKMMDEKVKFIYRANYQDSFTNVKAIDDRTVEYTLKTPGYCPAVVNSSLLNGIIPRHVFESLDINQNDVNTKPAVTSGTFKFKEWQKDDHFTAGPGYEGFVRGAPLLDSYTYRIVKDNTVATQLFKTQDIDVTEPDPIDYDEISKLPFANPQPYYSATGASWTYIGFNVRNAPLNDKVLRQAISMAINKKELVDKIRLGHAKPQFSMLPASSWAAAAESELPQFAFDPAKAKKLLDDAGYKVGADGIRVSKDGKPLKFRLHYNAGNKQREQIGLISQQYMKDIGISVEVIAEEWNAYLDRINKTRDMDMYILGWVGGYDPASSKNIWATDRGQNSMGYSNKEVDDLFTKVDATPGCKLADRKALYVQIQKLVAEDQPYVFLYTQENLPIYHKRINTLQLTGAGSAYNLEQLSVNPQIKK